MTRSSSVHPQAVETAMSSLQLIGDQRGDGILTLYVDGVESSAIDPHDPHHLEFEYMQHIRIALDAIFARPHPLRVLHLGGAGCALPRALDADRPGSRQLAIEIDRELAELARIWFDLPSSPRLRIRSEDARVTLDTNKGSWHSIVRDTFREGRIPPQLATAEAHAQAARLLTDDGVYFLNVAGEAGLAPVYREVQGLKESFAHIGAISDPAIFKGRRFGNVILMAAQSRLPMDEIDRLVRKLPLPTVVVSEQHLTTAAQGFKATRDSDVNWPPEPLD